MMSKLMTRREQLVLAAFAGAILLGAAALLVHHRPQASPVPDPLPAPMATITPIAQAPIVLPELPEPMPIVPVPAPPPEKRRIRVAVAGAVHLPGTFGFDQDDRVTDALQRAGGTRDDANLSDINLAAPLIDGTTLTIPIQPQVGLRGDTLTVRRPDPAAPIPAAYTLSGWTPPVEVPVVSPGTDGTSLPESAPSQTVQSGLDLNRATKEELEGLPGIGPVLADRILAERARGRYQSVDDLQRVSGIGPKKLEALRPLAYASP